MPHDAIYTAAYFAQLDLTSAASADAIAAFVVRRFQPRSAVDVGCGTGALLAALARAGVSSTVGLERAEAGLAICRARGLHVQRLDLECEEYAAATRFDVAICLEVAEHLPPTAGDKLVFLLCAAGRVVVFTAATPGQGGTDHVNEQPHEYWVDRFRRCGFALDARQTEAVRAEWKAAGTADWYQRNALIFQPDQRTSA